MSGSFVARAQVHRLATEGLRLAQPLGSIMSPTMTAAAPRICAEYAAASPTGPAPATYTVDPVVTPAV